MTIKTSEDLERLVEEARMEGLTRWFVMALTDAFEDARKGKLRTHDEHHFELNYVQNITSLANSALSRRYRPGSSTTFIVREPMMREIFAAPFRDRVIHHFLYNMSAGWWDRRFIYTSSSCREGKGTLFAARMAQKHLRQVTMGGRKKAWVAKFDLKGYFMSLPRQKLYERVHKGLRAQFSGVLDEPLGYQIYSLCDFLWKMILLDDPVEKAVRKGKLSDWKELPPEKSLYNQMAGVGIVIGNLTSQLVSNIYLDQLDRYVTHALGYRFYGRYVDDFYIMVGDEDLPRLKEDIKKIRAFLKDELKLTLHPKKFSLQPAQYGTKFVGTRVYPHALIPDRRLQGKFRAAAWQLAHGYDNMETLVSYLGMMKHLDADKLVREAFEELRWGFES